MSEVQETTSVWFPAARTAELRRELVGQPLEDEVQVRTKVSLVSPGTEMTIYRGQTASAAEAEYETMDGTWPFPLKFGYQVVGEVTAAGEKSGYHAGDRLFCYHPHQALFNCPVQARTTPEPFSVVHPIPEGVSYDQAAFANLYSVAFNAVLDVPVRPGEVVVVSGLGIVGHFIADLVRPVAGRLILIDPLPTRRDRAAYLGADAVVSPADAEAAVAELSDGRGADVSYEVSGAAPALQGMLALTGQEGTIGVVSYYGSRDVTLRLAPEFHLRRHRIVSTQVTVIGSGLQPRWDMTRRMGAVMDRLAKFDVEPLLSHRVAFSDAPSAYSLIDEHPEDTLGVMLDYDR